MKTYIKEMPEMRDEVFSKKLFRRFKLFAECNGVYDFLLEISEKYSDEENPHYHFGKGSAFSSDLVLVESLLASYVATADGKSHSGKVTIVLISNAPQAVSQNLLLQCFYFYDQYIREYYSEWKTIYQKINFY